MKDIKEVLSELSKNEEFLKRFDEITKNETDIEKAKLLTLQLINEYGYEFTEADFASAASEQGDALSDNELEAVAAGADCYCFIGGGSSGNKWTCACPLVGFGFDGYGHACNCYGAGGGLTLVD